MSNKRLLIACALLGIVCAAPAAEAAQATVRSNIAFAGPTQTSVTPSSNSSELSLPVLIRVNTFGSVWVDRQAATKPKAKEKDHDVINFMGPNDQLMNFLTLEYTGENLGTVVPVRSVCSLSGGEEGGSCSDVFGAVEKYDREFLYSGVDKVFLTSLAPSASKYSALSAFDLFAVYQ